jgi:uncharacterized protein (DUF952 family)
MAELFHITERASWMETARVAEYRMSTRGITLDEQGYIHCSLRHQLTAVAETIYDDADDLVILVIDSGKLADPVRYEAPELGAEEYPHIYGSLPADAVIEVFTVCRDDAGRLVLPQQ